MLIPSVGRLVTCYHGNRLLERNTKLLTNNGISHLYLKTVGLCERGGGSELGMREVGNTQLRMREVVEHSTAHAQSERDRLSGDRTKLAPVSSGSTRDARYRQHIHDRLRLTEPSLQGRAVLTGRPIDVQGGVLHLAIARHCAVTSSWVAHLKNQEYLCSKTLKECD
ncbi:hypothetical protein J6590_088091 [Homalodisca vitripennis]|nr:hypothetical protein J6590_088091 [Homalodisca vitripennis]